MQPEDIAIRLEGHEHEIKSLKHRVDDLEADSRAINDLALSVQKLAINMESMLEEQKRQNDRLDALEHVPMETTRQVKTAVITALISAVIGAVVTAIITLL